MKKQKIIIIGAGPCGLGAGYRLAELGIDSFHIYERESHPGGLASSYVDDNGFTWDVGGHVIHSHYSYFDAMFENVMKGEYFTHERESWIWLYDRFVPYPFQNNIHRLPKEAMQECLDGLKKLNSTKPKEIKNFADWILASFGPGIAKHFLYPYNQKVWAYPPEKMNFSWVGDRVATVDIKRIETNIQNNTDDVSWGPNATFKFPSSGGTGEIWKRVAARFSKNISYNKAVTKIDDKTKKIFFTDGTSDFYDVLLTTMPLDAIVPRGPLHYSRVTVVGIGIAGKPPGSLQAKCWMYFPENIAPFFRATIFSNYSKFNAPSGSWSLMTETASSLHRPLPSGDIKKLVLEGAKNTKLIAKDATIESIWLFQTDHGYPTPTLNRDEYLKNALEKLEKKDIYSRGRFGGWKYEVSNQDHTFMQGAEWANKIINNEAEITYFHPSRVNK